MTGEQRADPVGHGADRVGGFTVLYDEGCPLCRTARRWLGSRAQLVPLTFVPAGSAEARTRMPGLDHDATLRELTVIADTGEVYAADGAWLTCLWALADYRGMAERLSQPHLLPAARGFIAAAAAVRRQTRTRTTVASVPKTAAADADDTDPGAAGGSAADDGDDEQPAAQASHGSATDRPRGRVRGEQTRQLILDTALRLFRERGYGDTTMRAIAKEAGVAVGNAYYYFDSKEHLIQGFYDRSQAEHRAAATQALADKRDFAARLRAALHAGIDVNTAYHSFAATLFKSAAEPTSPLSPFSAEASPARKAAIAIFADVVDGSSAKIDPELRRDLPELLWLGYMGVILYWVHDRSPEQRKTRALIDGVVPLVDRLVSLSRLRVLRPVLRQTLDLIGAVRRD